MFIYRRCWKYQCPLLWNLNTKCRKPVKVDKGPDMSGHVFWVLVVMLAIYTRMPRILPTTTFEVIKSCIFPTQVDCGADRRCVVNVDCT